MPSPLAQYEAVLVLWYWQELWSAKRFTVRA